MSTPDFAYYLTDFEAERWHTEAQLYHLADRAAYNAIWDWCHDNGACPGATLRAYRGELRDALISRAHAEENRRLEEYRTNWLNENMPLRPEYECYANAN